MGLTSTLNIAQSSLNTNAALTTLLSRNIAGVNDPHYTRKTANLTTDFTGAAILASVSRNSDDALFGHVLTANSEAASAQALSDGLDQIETTINLTSAASTTDATATSPASRLGAFTSAMEQYEATPDNTASGQGAVTAAKALASSLNTASKTVQGVRTRADGDIASAVAEVNTLLAKFQSVNDTLVQANGTKADVTDALDARDAILNALSQTMGLMTVPTPNGGMALFTDGGATLFQGTARPVTFATTNTYTAGTTGGAVVVDGVPITGSAATMPLKSGKIAGLATLRDQTAVNYQNQLDQMAGGLIAAFTETKPGGVAPVQGLFTGTASGAGATGLATSLAVNANADPSRGGDVTRLRDGGIGSPGVAAYNTNATGAAAYSDHLSSLVANLVASRTFDSTSGGVPKGSVADYAASSISWLEVTRQNATNDASDKSTVATQTTASLAGETGVNLDDQLSKMLDLEHSYQASAELISTVKTMFDALFSAVN